MIPWNILNSLFGLFYSRFAFLADPLLKLIFRGKWIDWQREIETFIVGKRKILEIGCGTGSLLVELAKKNREVAGLDLSSQMLRIAAGKGKKTKKRVPLVRGKAENLPFKDGAFDVVFSMFPAPWILLPETINGIRRILGSEGVFICLPWVKMKARTVLSFFQNLIYGKADPGLSHLASLANKEHFRPTVRTVVDNNGNVCFFLFCSVTR
jgi:ubiquinone/menaquinone biosynthesis C-methylase UbiE